MRYRPIHKFVTCHIMSLTLSINITTPYSGNVHAAGVIPLVALITADPVDDSSPSHLARWRLISTACLTQVAIYAIYAAAGTGCRWGPVKNRRLQLGCFCLVVVPSWHHFDVGKSWALTTWCFVWASACVFSQLGQVQGCLLVFFMRHADGHSGGHDVVSK